MRIVVFIAGIMITSSCKFSTKSHTQNSTAKAEDLTSTSYERRSLLIGGSDPTPDIGRQMWKLVKRPGGAPSRIVYIAWAWPEESTRVAQINGFKNGVEATLPKDGSIDYFESPPLNEEQANAALESLRLANGVYFEGGDQDRLGLGETIDIFRNS